MLANFTNRFKVDVPLQKTFTNSMLRPGTFLSRDRSRMRFRQFSMWHTSRRLMSEYHLAPLGFVRNKCGDNAPADVCAMLDISFISVCLS